VSGNQAELARGLNVLMERFMRLSAQVADAGKGLLERRALPTEGLVEELVAIRADFEALRAKAAAAAAALSIKQASPGITGVRELAFLVKAIVEEEARQARRHTNEEAQQDTRRRADEEAKRQAGEDARRKAEEEARRRGAEAEAKRKAQAQEEGRRRAQEEARRKAKEPVAPAAAPAPETAEDLGLETAQWWISASASWGNMRSRKAAFPDAVRDVLTKYPYVFSVPIQTSAELEDGLLAYGYAVLLEFVEQRAHGFVSEALNRLATRKGASLGQRLYDYLSESLQGQAYAEFIKAVMLVGLPKPGLWVNGGIEESEATTTVFQRPSGRIGDSAQKAERLAQEGQRSADHQFVADVAPLTARFFRFDGADLKEARDIHIQLADEGAPSDDAWIVLIQGREGAPKPRRHERQGSTVATLIRDCAVWIGLFNPEAENERHYELTVSVKRRGPGPSAPEAR
jgi:hypothetical protein